MGEVVRGNSNLTLRQLKENPDKFYSAADIVALDLGPSTYGGIRRWVNGGHLPPPVRLPNGRMRWEGNKLVGALEKMDIPVTSQAATAVASSPPAPALPPGPFDLIYADPPWRFEPRNRDTGLEKAPDKHYDTMSLDKLKALPVVRVAAKDALLAMWCYDPMLDQAQELGQAWGFKFVTPLFRWLKTTNGQSDLLGPPKLCFGTGYHTRGGGCEECWLFKRGKGLKVLNHGIRKEFYAPRREHSRKPDEVATWLEQLYGDQDRLEMFARTQRSGWTVWGNEVERFP